VTRRRQGRALVQKARFRIEPGSGACVKGVGRHGAERRVRTYAGVIARRNERTVEAGQRGSGLVYQNGGHRFSRPSRSISRRRASLMP
jgi:hypothetical protein